MCVSGGFRWVLYEIRVESGGFCVSQGGIRWVPCVYQVGSGGFCVCIRWVQVGSF